MKAPLSLVNRIILSRRTNTHFPGSSRCRFLTTTEESSATANHRMNCAAALIKQDETKGFKEISTLSVTALQGIGPVHAEQLKTLSVETVQDLARYKYYHLARAIVTLAQTEENDGRLPGTVMNMNKALDKEWESSTLTEIVEQPVSVLQGLTEQAAQEWESLGCHTVKDLAKFKYCTWAEAMLEAAKYEEETP